MSIDKDSKTIQREKIIFRKCSWENGVHMQKSEAGALFHIIYKKNQNKWNELKL